MSKEFDLLYYNYNFPWHYWFPNLKIHIHPEKNWVN
jgi:hypothetical protein